MNYLLLHEIFSLFFHCCGKNPELFISFFNSSNNLIAFNYNSGENQITHISKSYSNILGFKSMNFLNNGNISDQIIHPKELTMYDQFFKSRPGNSCDPNTNGHEDIILGLKCRIKHVHGYWKYLDFYSTHYWNDLYQSINKIGIILDHHVSQNYGIINSLNGSIHVNKISSNCSINILPYDSLEHEVSISNREKEVLVLIGQGLIAKEIANQLRISTNTEITHRKNLISKFRVKNTPELIKAASRLMII